MHGRVAVVLWLLSLVMGECMPNHYTDVLGEYPYTNELRKSEGSRAKRYNDPGGTGLIAIGYGHLIENEEVYTALTNKLGIKEKENLTEKDRRTLLTYDINLRRGSMIREYPEATQANRDAMLSVRFQFSPQGFDKYFGEALRNNDKVALQAELERLGEVFSARGQSGVNTRWKRIRKRLDNLKE